MDHVVYCRANVCSRLRASWPAQRGVLVPWRRRAGGERKDRQWEQGAEEHPDLVASSVNIGAVCRRAGIVSRHLSDMQWLCSTWPHGNDELRVTMCLCPCSRAWGVGSSGLQHEQNCKGRKGPRDHLHPKHCPWGVIESPVDSLHSHCWGSLLMLVLQMLPQ